MAVLGLSYLGASGFWFNLQGYALFLAVPVAAWSGIFVSDVLIRRIAYHEVSLSRSYGFYKAVNITNTAGWLLAVALGWGLLKNDLREFQWLGYLADLTTNAEFLGTEQLRRRHSIRDRLVASRSCRYPSHKATRARSAGYRSQKK